MWKKIDNDIEILETPDRIEEAKKDLASYTREQLLKRTYDFQSDDHRKAAILLLAEMDKKDADFKHLIIVIITVLTLLVAALTLAAQITGFQWSQFFSASNTIQTQQELKTNKDKQQQQPKSVVPPQVSPQPNKTQSQSNNSKTK